MKQSTVLALALLSLVIARCSGDDDSSEPKASAESTSTAPTTTSESQTQAPDGEPGDAMKQLIRYQSLGQYGRVWDLLHPAHQEIAPRSFYDGCARDTVSPLSGELDVEVIEVYDDPIDIPAIPEKTSKAVTYRMVQKGTDLAQNETSHLVNVNGEWRWVLAPQTVPYYKRGECPPL